MFKNYKIQGYDFDNSNMKDYNANNEFQFHKLVTFENEPVNDLIFNDEETVIFAMPNATCMPNLPRNTNNSD